MLALLCGTVSIRALGNQMVQSAAFVPGLDVYVKESEKVNCSQTPLSDQLFCESLGNKNEVIDLSKHAIEYEDPYELTFLQQLSRCQHLSVTLWISGAMKVFPACLKTLGGSLIVENNERLTNFVGFNQLEEIHGDLIIRKVKYLSSFQGLNKLKHVRGSFILEETGVQLTKSAIDQLIFAQGKLVSLRRVGCCFV